MDDGNEGGSQAEDLLKTTRIYCFLEQRLLLWNLENPKLGSRKPMERYLWWIEKLYDKEYYFKKTKKNRHVIHSLTHMCVHSVGDL